MAVEDILNKMTKKSVAREEFIKSRKMLAKQKREDFVIYYHLPL